MNATAVFAALVATWAILGVVYVPYRAARGLCIWLENYYGNARRYMEEAQLRRAELEQAMESLAHANRQLALANERSASLRKIAEEAEKAKTMFVANVSHEFRTPLNMIIGLVELMVESPQIYAVTLPPKMREDLIVVQRNCEHLSNMINDVLDLTRIEAGHITLHRERVQPEPADPTCGDRGQAAVGEEAAVAGSRRSRQSTRSLSATPCASSK